MTNWLVKWLSEREDIVIVTSSDGVEVTSANVTDLTAEAKDCKKCPRGQGHVLKDSITGV